MRKECFNNRTTTTEKHVERVGCDFWCPIYHSAIMVRRGFLFAHIILTALPMLFCYTRLMSKEQSKHDSAEGF